MTKKAPPEKIEKPALPVMGDAVQLYGILPEKEAAERERHRQLRELTANPQASALVRVAQSAARKQQASIAGKAPKSKRATKMNELSKKLAEKGLPKTYVSDLQKRLPEREVIAALLRKADELGIEISAPTIRRSIKAAKTVSRN